MSHAPDDTGRVTTVTIITTTTAITATTTLYRHSVTIVTLNVQSVLSWQSLGTSVNVTRGIAARTARSWLNRS